MTKNAITYFGIFLEEVGRWNRSVVSRGGVEGSWVEL